MWQRSRNLLFACKSVSMHATVLLLILQHLESWQWGDILLRILSGFRNSLRRYGSGSQSQRARNPARRNIAWGSRFGFGKQRRGLSTAKASLATGVDIFVSWRSCCSRIVSDWKILTIFRRNSYFFDRVSETHAFLWPLALLLLTLLLLLTPPLLRKLCSDSSSTRAVLACCWQQ